MPFKTSSVALATILVGGAALVACGDPESGGSGIGPPVYRVFVTSTTYSSDLGGLSGADGRCTAVANAAGWFGGWTAWLANDTTDAKSRIPDAAYYRVDGAPVAASKADLTDGMLAAPINVTEIGTVVTEVGGVVATGATDDGVGSGENCDGWTSTASNFGGTLGEAVSDDLWSYHNILPCDFAVAIRLYCFSNGPVRIPSP